MEIDEYYESPIGPDNANLGTLSGLIVDWIRFDSM